MDASRVKHEFPALIRKMRLDRKLKQREAAEIAGVNASTWGNIESSNRRIIGARYLERIITGFGLGQSSSPTEAQVRRAFETLPDSEYSNKQKEVWRKRSLERGKFRHLRACKASMLELLTLLAAAVPEPESLCSCDFGGSALGPRPCELCAALNLIGIESWKSTDEVMPVLAKAMAELEAETAKARGGGKAVESTNDRETT